MGSIYEDVDFSTVTNELLAAELERLADLEDEYSSASAGDAYREAARRLRQQAQTEAES